jgi:hypothetical protein
LACLADNFYDELRHLVAAFSGVSYGQIFYSILLIWSPPNPVP